MLHVVVKIILSVSENPPFGGCCGVNNMQLIVQKRSAGDHQGKEVVPMRRVYLVLAMLALVVISALPATAQSWGDNHWEDDDNSRWDGGNDRWDDDNDHRWNDDNDRDHDYDRDYNNNVWCGWFPGWWGKWSYWCYSPFWGWWELF
jgi:hypothetical protein